MRIARPGEVIYFAYGSNLCLPRLRYRVGSARLITPVALRAYELRWHKRSNLDGSGKLSISPTAGPEALIQGALYALIAEEKEILDEIEGIGNGYREIEVTVERTRSEEGRPRGRREAHVTVDPLLTRAYTYVAEDSHIDDSLRPFTWYRDLVIYGLEDLRAPAAYVATVRAIHADQDPDRDRDARERAFMSRG